MTSIKLSCLVVLWVVSSVNPARASNLETLQASVVRIVNHSQRGNWSSPWDVTGVGESSGSGFVIEGGLVVTNAHVVSDSRLLLLQIHDDPEIHVAEVLHIAHDCDLAIIRPTDPEVLKGIPALRFGSLPKLGTTVDTLGYPGGGFRVSSTQGVVSRIEHQLYAHSGMDVHVAVQTDAAINPGSSGGPVIDDNHVVGVAFQTQLQLENVGYFIPPEVIDRFLKDVSDGRYDGYPELGLDEANLENPAFRVFVGMQDEETGVRVRRVTRGCSADGKIAEGDILLQADGRAVANDGTVVDGSSRIPYGLLIDRKLIGEQVALRVLRDGKRRNITIPLESCPSFDNQGRAYDRLPRYLVYGGLVFVPLERETLRTFGDDWRFEAPKGLIADYLIRPFLKPELRLQERVVLLRRLSHPVNADLAWFRDEIVERVNGRTITSLDVLIETLEQHEGEFQVFEFATAGRIGALHRRKAEEAHQEILRRYGIDQDRRR